MRPHLAPLLLPLLLPALAVAAPVCTASSGARSPALVELYTSEGCNSCPPADRWLSAQPRDGSVVALAFHVDYWDNLGWRDRFGSAEHSRRQREQLRVNGSRFAYTPQVVIDGSDAPRWSAARPQPAAPAPLALQLSRDADGVHATLRGTWPQPLVAQWWRTEDGLSSAVAAGENRGVTLHHDHVVRQGQAVPAFRLDGPRQLHFQPQGPGPVTLVLSDAASGRPVQALRLGC